jgi:D-alanyl-D-alanine carboxypeptidase/D-alanyl-D-alanine-endopeptidase (penicillin-binding protein 4)
MDTRHAAPPAPLARVLALAGLLLALCGAPSAARAADAPLPAAVAEALKRAGVPADALAGAVLPLAPSTWRPGQRWLHQADRAMQPASTMKLLTTTVALDRLGPNLRGFTELLTQAPRTGDVLTGDLVLRGGADPELGLAQLTELLAELRYAGIREISGDIVLDRTLFRPARMDPGVPPFDQQPEFPYNMIPDALQLAGNLVALELSSQDPARPGAVVARALPPLPGLEIDASELRLSERACKDWDDDWVSPPRVAEAAPGTLRITLQGGFPRACTQRAWLQLAERNAQAERQLRAVWQALGGQWHGRVREAEAPLIAPVLPAAAASAPPALPGSATIAPGVAWAGTPDATPPGLRLLARRLARPWGELLRPLNKHSDNAWSRLLFLQLGLGAMAAEPGASTAELATREVQRWLAEHRIAAAGLVLDNGSGLSRSERISARQLAQVLQVAHQGRWAPELTMSLPVAGVDGSMRNRLKSGPAAGLARLKSGSLKDVVALAGYVPDPQGRWWALAAMINHDQARAARPALDALVDWVAGGGMTRRWGSEAAGP